MARPLNPGFQNASFTRTDITAITDAYIFNAQNFANCNERNKLMIRLLVDFVYTVVNYSIDLPTIGIYEYHKQNNVHY